MATMELDTKQSVVDNKTTTENQTATPVTPVTPKSAALDALMTPTTPKTTSTSTSSGNKQQRRRSEVTSPSSSSPRSIEHIQAEHQYLFNNLHRQDARIRSLLGALSAVQAQLQAQENAAKAGQDPLPLTTAEARKLRKSAGFIQSKIAAAERQEQMFVVRISELVAELQGRQWLAQLQQTRQSRPQNRPGQSQDWSAPRTVNVNVPVADLNLGPSSFSPGLTFSDPHGYFPLQMPQTPYLAPCEVWTPDQVFSPHGQPYGQPQGHPFGHHDHQHHPTATTNIILPPSFVVSPVTPGLHATMPASPVSPPASVTDAPSGSCMSPMSPLAPVFEPGSSFGSSSFFLQMNVDGEYGEHGDSAATPIARRPSSSTSAAQAAALDHVGMHYAYESAVAVDDSTAAAAADDNEIESSNENETGDSDVSDTAFLPPGARPRRVSHSATRPTQVEQKRMSLPPVRFAWPEEDN